MKWFQCCCTRHVLRIGKFPDDDEWDCEYDIEIAVFQHPEPLTLIEKLHWVWQILRWGNPWGDFVILKIDDAIKLRDYFNELFEEIESK